MYIHGFIDGALVTFVLGMAALITAAVITDRTGGGIGCPFPVRGIFCLNLVQRLHQNVG